MKICATCQTIQADSVNACPADGGAMTTVDELPAGAKLGVYTIVKTLGDGGMGHVYEAKHELLARRCAIKVLRSTFASDRNVVTRFLQEARAVNIVNHDNIVSIFDFADNGTGGVYFVMEFLEGETLADLHQKQGPLPLPLFLHLYEQLIPALASAHEKNIIHRDLKPANVVLVPSGDGGYNVKLLDFGIAKLGAEYEQRAQTALGDIMGTPSFMSPEQVLGATDLDARADVWALGVMMFRSLTGKLPFVGESFGQIAKAIMQTTPPAPSAVHPVPKAFDDIILRCLKRDRSDRWQTTRDIATAVANAREVLGIDEFAHLPTADASSLRASAEIRKASHAATGAATDAVGAAANAAAQPRAGVSDALGASGGSQPASSSSRGRLIAGACVLMLAGGGFAAWKLSQAKTTTTAVPTSVAPDAPAGPASPPVDAAQPKATPRDAFAGLVVNADSSIANDATVALDMVGGGMAADLLVKALGQGPQQKLLAGKALADAGNKAALPALLSALENSGATIRVELAACAAALGDASVVAVLRRGLLAVPSKTNAARGLLLLGDPSSKAEATAALQAALQTAPPSSPSWVRMAQALLISGHAPTQALVEKALTDSAAGFGAAHALLLAGGAHRRPGVAALQKQAADVTHPRHTDAALALVRAGEAVNSTAWLAAALASAEPDERKHAIAIVARTPSLHAAHRAAVASLVNDPTQLVAFTAQAALLAMEPAL